MNTAIKSNNDKKVNKHFRKTANTEYNYSQY